MLTDPRSPFFQLAASLATVQADAYRLTHDLTPPTPPPAEKPPQKPSQTAETWLCYACDFEYVDGEDSCHNHLCPEGLGTVKAPGWECAECGANDHPTGQCPHTRQTAKQAALELAYDRSQAASAIVQAVRRWRESKAGMSNTAPADALDRVFEAGEAYDALCAEDGGA